MHPPIPSGAPDFHAIFAATASAYLIIDPDFVIVDVNDAYLRATQRTRAELVGGYLFDVFPDNPDDREVDGVNILRASLERVRRTGEVDNVGILRYDIPIAGPEAGHFERRYWSPINTPVFDAAGGLTHIIHHAKDVTARIASEIAVRESERRYRALTVATSDVIYRMTPDWTHMHELDGRGFLKDTDSLGEYRIEDYVPPQDQAMARQAIEEAILNKTTFALEHRVVRADGSCGWTYSRAVPLLDPAGEIEEWIGSASDITERKLAEEQLREADRRKDEFLAMLAHELRNPLAPICSAAQLMQLDSVDMARRRHASQIIARQAAHMTHLIDDLLDVSRVTRGLVQLDMHPIDIRQVLAEAVEQVTPLLQSRHHRLDIHLAPERMIVSADKKRLVQAVANLLNNAAKFTPDGGNIRLHGEVREAQVVIGVHDDGIGMAPDTVDHAFELFIQAMRSSDRATGGLGLGLALVKSLVELHGGTAQCSSAGVGQGSSFTLRLPLAPEAPEGAEPQQTAAFGHEGRHGLRIMVVDDNVDAATTLGMLLETIGHEVVVEHDASAALARAQEARAQVFLLDIGLPGMDGHALAQRLRAQPAGAGALLVAVSGYGQEGDRQRSLSTGFDHHLTKPVDLEQLGAILARAGKS